MKNSLFATLLLITFTGCIRDQRRMCTPSPTPVFFRMENAQAGNLLNSATPGAYDTSNIFVASAKNNIFYRASILGTTDSIFINTIIIDNWQSDPLYYIRLSDGDIDTIAVSQVSTGNSDCTSYTINSLKYNGNEVIKKTVGSLYGYPYGGYIVTK